jgi:O-antigen ligase
VKRDLRWWGIVVLGAGLPLPFALSLREGASGSISVDLVVWPLVATALVLGGSREWRGLRRDIIGRLLLLFVIVSAASLPIGYALYHNLDGPRSFAYQVVLMLNFAAGYLILRTIDDIDLLIRAFAATIGVMSLALSIHLLQAGILWDVHQFHNSDTLAATIYGWPNGFSVLLAAALVLSLYVISTAKTRLVRRVYIACAISLAVCLVLTFSKTGWVAVAVALWLLWLRFWSFRRQLLLLSGIFATSVILFVLLSSNDSFRMQVFTLGTLEVRLRFVAIVIRHVNPLILLAGSGSQSLDTLTKPFANVDILNGITVGGLGPQDEFLNVLVKTGVVGLALLVAALAIVIVRTWRMKTNADSRTAHLFRYWYAAAWAIVVSLFSVDELHYWPVGALFWLMAGATVHLLPLAAPRSRPAEPEAAPATTSSR